MSWVEVNNCALFYLLPLPVAAHHRSAQSCSNCQPDRFSARRLFSPSPHVLRRRRRRLVHSLFLPMLRSFVVVVGSQHNRVKLLLHIKQLLNHNITNQSCWENIKHCPRGWLFKSNEFKRERESVRKSDLCILHDHHLRCVVASFLYGYMWDGLGVLFYGSEEVHSSRVLVNLNVCCCCCVVGTQKPKRECIWCPKSQILPTPNKKRDINVCVWPAVLWMQLMMQCFPDGYSRKVL